ncbi:ABC transporter permease [Ideonella azotifigens]|uniref:Sugar ABC transporter permease n=1 Tax=Ideonella azotifigens TaxID=513160 RepID=A0ABN1JYJ8_9BURK|nr:ABC transporter permease [Ideonella azotifigens]MCD2341496.1 ABC transporter permease [Ideonella azotifigens]
MALTNSHLSHASDPTARPVAPPREAAPVHQALPTQWRRVFGLREMGVYYALLILVLVLAVASAYTGRVSYLSMQNITNVMHQSSLTAVMAIAMTVILITGNFDLSVASVAALSAAVLIGLADSIGFWPAVGAAMLVAVLAGLLNGAIVQYVGINAFIVTLGTLTAIRGIVLIYTDGRSLSVESPEVIASMRAFESGRVAIGLPLICIGAVLLFAGAAAALRRRREGRGLSPASLGMLMGGVCAIAVGAVGGSELSVSKAVIYMLIFASLVWFVLTFTTVGRKLYAVGGNPEAARLSGINVSRYRMAAFILCSAAAGFAGVMFGSRLRSINPAALQGAELTVIASAILGGTSLFGGAGSVVKTLAGAMLLFTLTNGFNMLNLGANYQGLIEGTVIVIAAAIYTVGGHGRARAH